jgi:predicted kinase
MTNPSGVAQSSLRPLLITGNPAVGKSTIAHLVVQSKNRAVVIESDDLRQQVKSGAVPIWESDEGRKQGLLAIENAACLARNYMEQGFEVVISDFTTNEGLALYKDLIDDLLVVQLQASSDVLTNRSSSRVEYLTSEEVRTLQSMTSNSPELISHTFDTSHLSVAETCEEVLRIWTR